MLFAGEELLVNPRGEEIFRTYPSAGFHRCKRVEARPGAVLEREGLPLSKIYAQGAPETFPSLLKEPIITFTFSRTPDSFKAAITSRI